MSFRCQICKVPQPAGARPVTKVTERRERTYSTMAGDPIPGWEIAKEVVACEACTGESPMAKALGAEALRV